MIPLPICGFSMCFSLRFLFGLRLLFRGLFLFLLPNRLCFTVSTSCVSVLLVLSLIIRVCNYLIFFTFILIFEFYSVVSFVFSLYPYFVLLLPNTLRMIFLLSSFFSSSSDSVSLVTKPLVLLRFCSGSISCCGCVVSSL